MEAAIKDMHGNKIKDREVTRLRHLIFQLRVACSTVACSAGMLVLA
jgi:hypothetical protein